MGEGEAEGAVAAHQCGWAWLCYDTYEQVARLAGYHPWHAARLAGYHPCHSARLAGYHPWQVARLAGSLDARGGGREAALKAREIWGDMEIWGDIGRYREI